MKKLLLATIIFLASTVSFAGPLLSMTKAQLIMALQNKSFVSVPLATLNGELVKDSVVLYLDKNGQVDGKFTNKPANDLQEDRGVWKISPEGMLCVSWDHWNKGEKHCVMAYDLKNSILFVSAKNNTFETLVMKDQIKLGK